MERARHRRSKSASGTRQVQKRNTISRLSTDAPSYIGGSKGDDMLMLELGRGSFGQVTGVPMKMLLAEEISKRLESKRQSPNVIAKLMGLEVMPPPCHVSRQKRISTDSQRKYVSVNLQQNSQLHDGRLSRRSPINQQEFKDVYEDMEASHVVNRQCSSRWRASSIRAGPEGAPIQQKFIDAKHFSANEKLQDSKDLNDTLEMLDFLQKRDSLLVNHLHDLEVDSGSSVGSHIAVLKPLNSAKYARKAEAWRSQGDTLRKHHVTSNLKREDDLLLESHNCNRGHISCHLPMFQLDEKNRENKFPTKVVLLKPNLGKMRTSGLSSNPSNGYLHSSKKNKEFSGGRVAETLPRMRKYSHGVGGFSMPISTKARNMAREITMRMRHGCDVTGNVDTWSVGFKGYAGDESSYDANESDSESESEVFAVSSGKSFNGRNLCRYPSSHLGESSVSKEAKKRLSERWKMTQKYQDLQMIRKSNTLGEMLASSERETRPHHSKAEMSLSRPSNRRGNNSGTATQDGPLGISTADGWKDEKIKSSSRSRSLPPYGAERSPGRSTHHDELTEDKPMIRGAPVCPAGSKAIKGNFGHTEYNSPKDSKYSTKMCHSDQHMFMNQTNSSSEANFEIPMEANTEDLIEQQSFLQMTKEEDMLKFPVADVKMIAESESRSLPSKSPELNSKPLPSIIDGEKSSIDYLVEDSTLQELPKGPSEQGSSFLRCFETEQDPSDSSKVANHSSPVSVLEVPFTEDTPSSYESFERVSAELQELRMQLQLLKMESGECTDISTLIPIEEQIASPVASEGNLALGAQGWETCYTLDVLNSSGLHHSDFPNRPLDTKVFDILENKYKNDRSTTTSERKLLFDRINSTVLEMVDEQLDLLCPWVMPKSGLKLRKKEGVGDVLEKLMKVKFAEGEEISADEVVPQWAESSKEETEVIGNEIEKLLIDDIVTEFVSY